MGFYTDLSLNRVDVDVRDIFASPPTPAPSPQGPKSYFYGSFLVLRTGTATINKTLKNTRTTPQKRTNINFRNTHFYSALRYSQLAASYLVQFLGTCRHIFDIAGGTVHILVIKIQRRYISKHPETQHSCVTI